MLAHVAMHLPLVRALVVSERTRSRAAASLHTWNDLLGVFPGLIGVKTGHTSDAGWCEVAAARRRGLHDLRRRSSAARRARSATPISSAARAGASRGTATLTLVARRTYALAALPLRPPGRAARRARSRSCASSASSRPRGRAGRRAHRARRFPSRGARRSAGSRSGRAERLAGLARRSSPHARSRGRAVGGRRTVVRDASHARPRRASSRDRHRHAQRSDRPHAHRAELPARPSASRERRA